MLSIPFDFMAWILIFYLTSALPKKKLTEKKQVPQELHNFPTVGIVIPRWWSLEIQPILIFYLTSVLPIKNRSKKTSSVRASHQPSVPRWCFLEIQPTEVGKNFQGSQVVKVSWIWHGKWEWVVQGQGTELNRIPTFPDFFPCFFFFTPGGWGKRNSCFYFRFFFFFRKVGELVWFVQDSLCIE